MFLMIFTNLPDDFEFQEKSFASSMTDIKLRVI